MKEQPAKVNYFFSQGYTDLRNTIRDSWRTNIEYARDKFDEGSYGNWVQKAFWWAAALFVVIFGTVWFLALSLIHIVILFIFFLIVYFLFTFTWILDYLYRVKEKIFAACPNPGCYEKSSLPIYRCVCGAEHTQLWPSKYGIWKRTCRCGRKIPCTFFNGRSRLMAICPKCTKPMNTEEGTPLIIPIVGPPGAGKSTYLHSLIDNLTDEFTKKGYEIRSNISQTFIDASKRQLATEGRVSKTVENDTKAVDLIISKGTTKYAVYFYDVAGEAFAASQNIAQHKFYDYFSAMIFLLDPFAVEEIRNEYYEQFNDYLKKLPAANVRAYDNALGLSEVFVNLKLNLAEHYNIADKARVKQSLAVIIPKTDIFTDTVLTTDKECRHFLTKFGQTSFINEITWKFKNVRFFNAISKGKNSKRVLQPFEWILKREMAKKRIRRFFGNLLMLFFTAIVVGGLALGGLFAYNAVSDYFSNRPSKPRVAQTPNFVPAPATTATVTADVLNIRSQPNTSANVVKTVERGNVLTVTGSTQNGWVPVEHNGARGFVSAQYVTINNSSVSTGTSANQATETTPPLRTETGTTIPVSGGNLNKASLSLSVSDSETLTFTVLPTNATNKNVIWISNNPSVATVNTSGRVTAVAAGTASITARTADGGHTATCVVTVNGTTVTLPQPQPSTNLNTDEGVVINGVRWATRNVDNPGTFAATPESAGKFYQWNRKTAWAATGSVSGWDNSTPSGTSWARDNDPCPTGWHVPTEAELRSLMNAGNGWTTQNGVGGRRFGSGNNTIFLPAVGYRTSSGNLINAGQYGNYLSSTLRYESDNTRAVTLYFFSGGTHVDLCDRRDGRSVRCVADGIEASANQIGTTATVTTNSVPNNRVQFRVQHL